MRSYANSISFLLRIWRTGEGGSAVWRASLEMPGAQYRIGFGEIDELFEYLSSLMQEDQSGSAPQNRLHFINKGIHWVDADPDRVSGLLGAEEGQLLLTPEEDYLVLRNLNVREAHLDYLVFHKSGGLAAVEIKDFAGRVEFDEGCLVVNGAALHHDPIDRLLAASGELSRLVNDYLKQQCVFIKSVLALKDTPLPEGELQARGVTVIPLPLLSDEIKAICQLQETLPVIWEKRYELADFLWQLQ